MGASTPSSLELLLLLLLLLLSSAEAAFLCKLDKHVCRDDNAGELPGVNMVKQHAVPEHKMSERQRMPRSHCCWISVLIECK